MTVMVKKAVSDMHVKCSLDVRSAALRKRQPGFALSDACRQPATSAVETPHGSKLYRCDDHRGIVELSMGPVWETIMVQLDD